MISAPACVGMDLHEVDTPALILDLDVLEANIRRMQDRVRGASARLRPHSKTHKSTTIAGMQVAAGAIGICCQKVSEAEIMAEGGIADVMVSNQVVGERKTNRLAALARRATISVCVDHQGNVAELAAAARRFGSQLNVLAELNVGADRCGVEGPDEVLRLAEAIGGSDGLRFAGLQAYHGSAQHLREREARQAAIAGAARRAGEAVQALARRGIACDVVAGAGTGSYEFELESGLYNELQVGSYVFMDADYGRNRDRDGAPVSEFGHALFVLATVMSGAVPGRRIVDAGLKALSVDSGMPGVADGDGLVYARASDEHGQIDVPDGARAPEVGDRVRLIPGHCDPTVNLHDWYVGVRGGRVESVWPVSARGAVF